VDFVNKLWDKIFARHVISEWNDDEVPGHVICSSLASLAYRKTGLTFPKDSNGGVRLVDPDDWSEFCLTHTTFFGWID